GARVADAEHPEARVHDVEAVAGAGEPARHHVLDGLVADRDVFADRPRAREARLRDAVGGRAAVEALVTEVALLGHVEAVHARRALEVGVALDWRCRRLRNAVADRALDTHAVHGLQHALLEGDPLVGPIAREHVAARPAAVRVVAVDEAVLVVV